MKLNACLSLSALVWAGVILVACGGSNEPPKEPESIATPLPGSSHTGNWSAKTSDGTTPPTSDATTTSAHTTPAAQPAVAPQAPPAQPVPAGPCDACKGPVSSDLQAALNKRVENEARKCYERVLTNRPTARASLSLDVRVSRDGSTCDAVVQSDGPEVPGLADCVANEFRRGGFPSPGSSCVLAKVPILFTPKAH
ncbi:hypothetical protein LZC95_44380 [Pendulispora brunnea]|uniref:AgmX/PglI C-terminal domain-containing protein n=1 Tax=Pendulispora brunnea TaxID=2905690 RepID=A0ABZ2K466_9BACT